MKWDLLLEAIADKEQIHVAPEDVERRIQAIAEGTKKSVEFVQSKLEKDGRIEALKRVARLERVVDFLLRNARMERR